MRGLLVVCLLAGCYQPATESCYYRCAAGATPCPSGLACSAGMCVTPGEQCPPTGSDAVLPDSLPGIDAPPATCRNGIAVVGEICYSQAITIDTNTTAFADGVLGDYDGNGTVDLIYLVTGSSSGGVRVHLQTQGMFAATASGQGVPSATFLRIADLAPSPAVELIVGTTMSIQTFGYEGGGPMMLSSLTDTTLGGNAVLGGITNNGPLPDIVTIGTNLSVYRYQPSLTPMRVGSTPGSGFSGHEITAGRLDGDSFADIAIGGTSGITTFRGQSSGLISQQVVLMGTTVSDLEIGDVNRDGRNDIVFVVADVGPGPGQIGVMLGNGDGTFAAPMMTQFDDLGGAVALRDIDGDSHEDVIAVRTGAARALAIFRGRSDGLLEPPVFVDLPGTSAQISVRGDYNGDLVPDIVVTDRAARALHVFASDP